MDRPEAGWGTCLLGKASAGHLPPPPLGCCQPRPKLQSGPSFAGVSVGYTEHLRRALWKTERASGRGDVLGPRYGTVLPPRPAVGEPRGWFRHVSCITKEFSQPQKPQGAGSSAWGPCDRLLVLGCSGEDAPANGYERAEWWFLGL